MEYEQYTKTIYKFVKKALKEPEDMSLFPKVNKEDESLLESPNSSNN